MLYEILNTLFGLDYAAADLTIVQFCTRALSVYLLGMLLVRTQIQFFTTTTPFNYMLTVILGSLLAGALTVEYHYVSFLLLCLLIFFVNFVIEALCIYSPTLDTLVKGKADLIVEDGAIIWRNMRKNLLTEEQLLTAVRKKMNESKLDKVKRAYFEHNGDITIMPKD